MEQKEKAERYDEVIKKVNDYYEGKIKLYSDVDKTLDYLFPELKESEDEKMRKGIIKFLIDVNNGAYTKSELEIASWIAWLEKQGEPFDNIVQRARTEKQRILITESDGYANIDWDARSLQDVKMLLEYGLDYIKQGEQKDILEDAILDSNEDGLIAETIRAKQGDKKPTIIIPNFRVGDKIVEKDFNECGYGTIIDIKDGKYIFDNGGFICIEEQDLWQLVEQNPSDKVEPKFKLGDWIVWQNKCYKVNDNGCGYELVDQNGLSTSIEYGTIDENAHLWDITKDAKDGDVLASNRGDIIIVRMVYKNQPFAYCGVNNEEFMVSDSKTFWHESCYHPATKEQRNLLFTKMKKVGYEWDSERKKLKKIEQNQENASELSDFESDLFTAFSDAWQQYLHGEEVNIAQWVKEHSEELLDTAKKELCKQQLAWSEEDEQYIIDTLNLLSFGCSSHSVGEVKDFLKSLKNRVLPQPTSVWSEKDEDYINDLIEYFSQNERLKNTKEDIVIWLKSLIPQNTWKPSDEQMKALKEACDEHWELDGLDPLYTLFQNLKKLREE